MPLEDSELSKIEVIKAGMLEDTIEDVQLWAQLFLLTGRQLF